ncbi:MAG: hypothetical protein ABI170_06475 [Microbacteriaceae bacterium]
MTRVLNFVAIRKPSIESATPVSLASSSDFQTKLREAAQEPNSAGETIAVARDFAAAEDIVTVSDRVQRGPEFIALFDLLTDGQRHDPGDIGAAVRRTTGDLQPADWAQDARLLKDSVLAAYLLETDGPDAVAAIKIVRAQTVAETILSGETTPGRIDTVLRAPFALPDFLLGPRVQAAAGQDQGNAETPLAPDAAADALLHEFTAVRDRHASLGQALLEVSSHDEDELVLSELDEKRPLADLYRTRAGRDRNSAGQNGRKLAADDAVASSSPLRRAALRSNVILSDTAMRLLSEPAVGVMRDIGLDPATSSVRDIQAKLGTDHEQAGQTLRTLSIKLGGYVSQVNNDKRQIINDVIGKWAVDPIDDPTATEPVASAPPGTSTAVAPLGVADLCVVRTHILRYEHAEVASLENVLPGEKLTHTVRQLDESESTDTTETEQTDLQSLAQSTAEQNSGKTTAQAIGTGRGPLTSDGPETFSKSVTDAVSSSSINRSRNNSVLRHLRRNEEALQHDFDNSAGAGPHFGVYQWLDRIYQAQVFNYGSRLLYDLIVPEPAALFREALARPRSSAALPAKPAKFTVPVDKLSLENWSYYATGHQATGVEAPPQAQVIVTENFGGKAADPFGTELNANTLELGESRSTRVPKGFKATQYRVVALASGWTAFTLSVVVGSKRIAIGGDWSGKVFTGKLDGEVESLPVGLICDGDGTSPGISTLAVAIEIICEPTAEAISAWQTKTHGLIMAGNQQRFTDYEERVANRDATARLQLQAVTADRKRSIIREELKRTTLAVLTNQNFSTFNATRIDAFGFPYPDAAASQALSAYIRFFEQAVEWEHLECAFFGYFWGSRTSWVSKLLGTEPDPQFAAFLASGAARVVLPIRPGYESAFERFLNSGKTPTTTELLDAGSPLWASLVAELRAQGAEDDLETAVGDPWEFRLGSDLVRARRDDKLPRWNLTAGKWVEQPDADS